MKKLFIILALSVIFLSCESDSTTGTADEELDPFTATVTSTMSTTEYDCPASAQTIIESEMSVIISVKTSKLTKEGDSLKLKWRVYCPVAYLDFPAGWSQYYETSLYYKEQTMNKHKYQGSFHIDSNCKVIEISGTITAEDGTTCDLGVFRVGSAAYINL